MRISILITIFISLITISPAFAQLSDAQKSLAVTHYRSGESYYNQGRYSDAIREFKEAYRLSKKAALYYNIAQSYERMGKVKKAVKAYERYLSEGKKEDPLLREKIANLKAGIQKTAIKIKANAQDARVFVDGKLVGKTPLASLVEVSAGSHAVRIEKEGFTPYIIQVAVSSGATIDVDAKLTKAAIADVKTVKKDDMKKPVEKVAILPKPEDNGPSHLWTWVLAGVSGVGLTVGTVTGVMALGKASDAKTDSDSDADSAKSLGLISDISLGVGIAAGVTAVILYVVNGKDDKEKVTAQKFQIAPIISENKAGVGALMRF